MALVSLGAAYLQLMKLQEAMGDFDRAIERDPEYGAAYYSRLGEHVKAQEEIEPFTLISEKNVADFAEENNIWHSHHMTLEDGGITEPMHR